MPDSTAEYEVVCHVDGTITVKTSLEFAEKEELFNLLNSEDIRSKLAHVLTEILAHTYDYTSRGPDGTSLGWVDDNREAYVTEVYSSGLAVKRIDLYDVR